MATYPIWPLGLKHEEIVTDGAPFLEEVYFYPNTFKLHDRLTLVNTHFCAGFPFSVFHFML